MHQLYSLYASAMLNTAFRMVNNREDAEDVLQESFIKVFTRLHQFSYQSTFGAWVKRIVVNTSLDRLKKQKKTIISLEPLVDNHFNRLESQEHPPLNNGQIDQLNQAIHQLPDGYRTVFSLYMLEGYDHQEIATILNIGVSSSISQLSRAKQKIRSILSIGQKLTSLF